MRQNKYEYDAFISHAVEDKIPIANELCAKLEMAGLKIWYSGKELGVGDSIEKTIEKGLNRSRYGIVIFSPTYLAKNWTIREFYTLLAKEIEEQKVILPVLYNISLDELKNKDLLMADRFAVNADRGIDFVVERLVREIKKPKVVREKVAWLSRIWLVLIVSLLANVALLLKGSFSSEDKHDVLPAQDASHREKIMPALLDEMVRQINTCRCDHGNDKAPDANRAGAVQLVRSPNARLRIDGKPAGGGEEPPTASTYRRKVGGKMTMAVVFQIETAPQPGHELQDAMDDMLETIDLKESGDPFVTASNRENLAEVSFRDCTHGSNDAD